MNKKNRAISDGLLRLAIGASTVGLLLFLGGVSAQAAEWRTEPRVGLAYEFDDNADLTVFTIAEQEISGYIVDLAARFAYTSPLTEFHATPRFLYRNYGEPDFDSNDQFFTFGYNRKFRRSNFRITGNYGRERARTAERADVRDLDEVDDPDDIPDDDTGRVFVRGYRDRVTIAPQYTQQLTEKSSLGAGIRYIETKYDTDLSVFLNDYTDTRANINYRRAWSPRNAAIVIGSYRTYNSDCPTCIDEVTGYGLSFGVENELSETMTFRAVVGAEKTELETGVDNVSPVGSISLFRYLETITLFAQYQRTISGGGGGSLTSRDSFNLNFRRQLNDRVAAGLGVRAYQTDSLEEGPAGIDERDYIQLRALIAWNLTETVSLEAHYRYTIIDREVVGESANSNNIIVGINWRPTPIVRSR